MKITTLTVDGRTVTHITLSRRNLLTLLSKLERPESLRTIVRGTVVVTAEEDEEHYGERVPGPMHPHEEAYIAARKG